MLRRLGDLPLSDPVCTAAMLECRARDALREARVEETAGRAEAARVFYRQFTEDMAAARRVLVDATTSETLDAA